MQIVPSTALALLLVLVLVLRGPARGLPLLFAAGALGSAAAFNLPALGGASILVLDLGVTAAFLLVLVSREGPARVLGTLRPFGPGFWLLLVVFAGAYAAIFLPRAFAGATTVFGVSRDEQGIVETALVPSSGNITQLFRLMLGAMAFGAAATALRLRPDAALAIRAMAAATIAHVALGWLDVITWRLGIGGLLDIIRTANYSYLDEATMGGLKRMVGGYPEASSYGGFCLGLVAFWLHLWVRGVRPRLSSTLLALSLLALVRSTSSGSYVALAAFLAAYGGLLMGRLAMGPVPPRVVGALGAGALGACLAGMGVVTLYLTQPAVAEFLDQTLLGKLDSESGVERMSWNTQAWRNFTDTYGLGAGLGSVRASSWLMASLASLGAVGTALYLAFMGSLAMATARTRDPMRDAAIGGGKAACLAILMGALLSGATPDLGVFFFLVAGLAAGLSRGGALEAEGRRGFAQTRFA